MDSTFNLRNITKIFSGITALNNVSLQIHKGEILALLGPNGSGKSTLLRILAFLEKPSKGEVYFYGKKVTDKNMSQMRLESTMVFQKTMLFSTTVYENIAYGLKVRRMPKNEVEEKVDRTLRLARLEGFEKRQAKKLSGGEQQRVALARALVLNTKLLLLDEPTANLDPKNASIIEEVIAEANQKLKITIVMATHNMFQAKNLPHRIALIKDGKIDEVGTPAEIFGRFSKTLASFAALENTFNGTAKVTEDGTTLVDIGNGIHLVAAAQGSGSVSIFVSPEDIILSRDLIVSSARNLFKGRVVGVSDLGSIVKLQIDAGKQFVVQITKCSFNEMQLSVDSEVYMAFKASSVHLV
jgi:tungstate transport system ATP-binding protein